MLKYLCNKMIFILIWLDFFFLIYFKITTLLVDHFIYI